MLTLTLSKCSCFLAEEHESIEQGAVEEELDMDMDGLDPAIEV